METLLKCQEEMCAQLACGEILVAEGSCPGFTEGSGQKERLLTEAIATGALAVGLSESLYRGHRPSALCTPTRHASRLQSDSIEFTGSALVSQAQLFSHI